MKILLTGTSGNLGSRVLKHILDHDLIPSDNLAISTTSPHNVAGLAKQNGIDLVSGDFTCTSSTIADLAASFAATNADTLFLVSFPSPSVERWIYHRNAIDAAKQSGCIKLVVYTSLMYGGASGMHSVAGVQTAHIRTVEYLRQCGLEYIVLREGIYAESWWLYCGFQDRVLTKNEKQRSSSNGKEQTSALEFVVPSDGPVAWVSWDGRGCGGIVCNIRGTHTVKLMRMD